MQLPPQTQQDMFLGNFEKVRFAPLEGSSGYSYRTCLFYAGVLAFSDGFFALKIPSIASSQRKGFSGAADPPLLIAVATSFIIRWLYCILASTALTSQELQNSATSSTAGINYALIGIAIFLMVRYIPEIVSEQGQIQELVFYRGFIDLPSSLVIAFLTPWALAMVVH